MKSWFERLELLRYLRGFLLCLFLFLNSCSPLYFPNMVNSPLLRDKGECQLMAGNGNSGYNAQLAYAPINHLGLIAGGSLNNSPHSDFYTYNVGAGYFGSIPEDPSTKYELFMGAGKGKIMNQSFNFVSDQTVNADYTHLFLQSGLGLENRFVGGGIALRLSYIDMQIADLSSSKTGNYRDLYFEPAINLKIGYKNIKFIIQAELSQRLTGRNSYNYDYNFLTISLGLQFILGRQYLNDNNF